MVSTNSVENKHSNLPHHTYGTVIDTAVGGKNFRHCDSNQICMLDKCMDGATMFACYKNPFQNLLEQKYTLRNLLNQLVKFLEARSSLAVSCIINTLYSNNLLFFLSVNKTNDALLINQAHEMCNSLPSDKTSKKYSLDNVFVGKAPSNAMAFGTIFVFVFLVAELVF